MKKKMYQAVQTDSQNRVGVAVVAYFRSLFEVANFQHAVSIEADYSHEATRKESLYDANVLFRSWKMAKEG